MVLRRIGAVPQCIRFLLGQKNVLDNCCVTSDGKNRQAAESSFSSFFSNLFETSSYPPRWECGAWSSLEGWMHIAADIGIFASYFAIPAIMLYMLKQHGKMPLKSLLMLFSAFILLCGTGHLLEAIIFYWPAYRLAGILKVATAIVSIVTAASMVRVLPEVLKLAGLISKNLELQKADLAKSEFLANMSHEIRTPMTAILGYAELLLESSSESERTVYARTIRRNGEHLLAVLNDILDLSKIEAGKLEVEHIPCELPSLVRDVIELQSVRAESKRLSLKSSISANCPRYIMADPVRLRQVLLNLVGNAIKFTEIGGVEIRLDCVHAQPLGDELRISVVDSGIGMNDEQLSKAFTAFSQADSSTSRRFGGTGLGLAISRRLMELMGGTILIDSGDGLGSTFTVVIPITNDASLPNAPNIQNKTGLEEEYDYCPLPDHSAATAVELAQKKSSESAKLLAGRRILLAEDGIDNQRLISHVLRKSGATVEVAENGAIAVEWLLERHSKFDVVLMDMQMPVLDGYMATEKLRREGYTGPIIALTAHAMAGDRLRCLEAGCDEYLTKPVDRQAIVDTIFRLTTSSSPKIDSTSEQVGS